MPFRRSTAKFLLLGLAWQAAVAADDGRPKPFYSYPSDPTGSSTRAPWESGSYPARPGASGAVPTWSGSGAAGDRGGSYASPSYGGAGSFRDKPQEQYRFRQRPEDRRIESPDALRYRPDPDLARRSYQNWGVPGQEWSEASRGPAVIFRPRDQEHGTSDRRSPSAPAYPDVGTPGPGIYPDWPPAYGPPY